MESLLLPLFPLEVVLFPGQPLPLHIFEERYKEMIGECLENHSEFGVVLVKENTIVNAGCTAEITTVIKRHEDGRMDIETAGRRRFEVLFLDDQRSYLRAAAQFFDDEDSPVPSELREKALAVHQEILGLLFTDTEERKRYQVDTAAAQLSFLLSGPLPVDLDFKQTLLGMRSESERLGRVVEYLEKLNGRLQLISRVRAKVGANGQGR